MLSLPSNNLKLTSSSGVVSKKISTNGTSKTTLQHRPVPEIGNDTGYIKGYEKVNKNEEKRLEHGLNVDARIVGNDTYLHSGGILGVESNQYNPEYDMDNFKYEFKFHSDHEDPALLGFEIYIDDTTSSSPFWANNNENKVMKFLVNYKNIEELNQRTAIFTEFRTRFFEIFNSILSENVGGSNKYSSKNYYITSIKGTDAVVNKKIINYPEDKITITLNEDITMTAQYLAELYNTLIYSYKSNRYMIPESLFRFDMYIKVNDMRSFRTGDNFIKSKAVGMDNIPRTLDKKKSYIIYTLHDCNLNFFDSKNSPDEMVVGGVGAGANSTSASLSFDVKFKSVSKHIEPILKNGAYSIFNKPNLVFSVNSGDVDDNYFKMVKNGDELSVYNSQELYKYQYPIKTGTSSLDKKSEIKKKKGYEKYLDKAKGAIKHVASETVETVKQNLKEKRDELINRLVSQIKDKTTIQRNTDMGNVYDGDNRPRGTEIQKLGNKIFGDVIRNLEGDRKQLITKGKSAMTDYIVKFDKKIGF